VVSEYVALYGDARLNGMVVILALGELRFVFFCAFRYRAARFVALYAMTSGL
jgi:hypothetical protein